MSVETLFLLLVLGLASHEALTLWFNGSIFTPIKRRLMQIHRVVAEGVNCPICMSVWCTAFVIAAWFVPYGFYLVYLLAAMEIAGFFQAFIALVELRLKLSQR